MNECIPKLCITVCPTTRLECLERNGTHLTIRNMPVVRGQILGSAWPVLSLRSPAGTLPELSRHPEIEFVSQHLDGTVVFPFCYLRS